MGLFDWFGKKSNADDADLPAITADMHSHFLPGIDDGSKDLEESVTMIGLFAGMGFKTLVTTPHVLTGFYDNTPAIVNGKLEEVRKAVADRGIDIRLFAAAEYFCDEHFTAKVADNEELLSFGTNKYVLIETGFLNEPVNMVDIFSQLRLQGYSPILAHPERYTYFNTNFQKCVKHFQAGALFQINALSLAGYYDKPAQKMAEWLIDQGMVHFVGSDCHKPKHAELYRQVRSTKYYQKLRELPLHNHNL